MEQENKTEEVIKVKKVYNYGAEYRKQKNKAYYEANKQKILNYHKEHVNNQPKPEGYVRKGRGKGKKSLEKEISSQKIKDIIKKIEELDKQIINQIHAQKYKDLIASLH